MPAMSWRCDAAEGGRDTGGLREKIVLVPAHTRVHRYACSTNRQSGGRNLVAAAEPSIIADVIGITGGRGGRKMSTPLPATVLGMELSERSGFAFTSS